MFILGLLGGCGISMELGLDRLGRIPGVELGPGVESPRGVGVLDFSPGVPALSRCQREGERERGFRNTQEIWLTTDTCTRHRSIHPPGLSNRMQKMWKMFDPYHCHLFGLEGGGARWWCSGSWTTWVFLKKACFIQAIFSRWGERCATRRGWILAKGKEYHVISIYVSLPLQTTTIGWTINNQNKNQTILTSFETSTTKLSSLFSPSLSCKDRP